ncbi:MAG TPA: LLM class flavin-dependent oxidoreductase [Stellaceae bacterium]|nr:LLM class flavin-dependent oxidoreductase [Stellaceae bacterium]
MTVRDATSRERATLHNRNRLKIGLFGSNCSSGRAVTLVPERWSGSWHDNLRLARIADEAGIDFMLPVARWRGYGGDTDYQGATLETVTWATGLLANTRRMTVFGTVHAPLFHPLIAAKEFVTADHVGEGRFGLNLVCGWNEGEFDMFGATLRDHESRYDYAQEWLDAVKLAWSSEQEFDLDGTYIHLKNVRSWPKPWGGTRPVIMNAGASGTGQAFAIRNCDALFMSTRLATLESYMENVRGVKDLARAEGRELDFYTVGVITCRPTMREAEEYYRHTVVEHADWNAVDSILAMKNISPKTHPMDVFTRIRNEYATGMGGLPLVGDPDYLARELSILSEAGLTGIGVSFVNFADELPYFCDEVLPRLERMGLREKR